MHCTHTAFRLYGMVGAATTLYSRRSIYAWLINTTIAIGMCYACGLVGANSSSSRVNMCGERDRASAMFTMWMLGATGR